MKYPDLCSTIVKVKESIVICPVRFANTSVILDPILFRLNGSLLKLRDELYLYARDNLAVVNIYIKDATVTKIRRDQKVTNSSDVLPILSTIFFFSLNSWKKKFLIGPKWYFVTKIVLTWFLWLRKTFEIQGWMPEQFSVTKCLF